MLSEELKFEIDTMKAIGHHQNIITLFGCNTLFKPNMVVMELAQFGDLATYLQNKMEKVLYLSFCCNYTLLI